MVGTGTFIFVFGLLALMFLDSDELIALGAILLGVPVLVRWFALYLEQKTDPFLEYSATQLLYIYASFSADLLLKVLDGSYDWGDFQYYSVLDAFLVYFTVWRPYGLK